MVELQVFIVVGVSMGTTLNQVVSHIKNPGAKKVTFVPLIGGMGHLRMELHSNYSSWKPWPTVTTATLSPCTRRRGFPIPWIRDEFMRENSIARVIKLCDRLDVAIVGIGYPNNTSAIMATGYYGQDEMEPMRDKEVAGDICMQFFNAAGETAPYKSDNNVIGIEIKKLRKVPHPSASPAVWRRFQPSVEPSTDVISIHSSPTRSAPKN